MTMEAAIAQLKSISTTAKQTVIDRMRRQIQKSNSTKVEMQSVGWQRTLLRFQRSLRENRKVMIYHAQQIENSVKWYCFLTRAVPVLRNFRGRLWGGGRLDAPPPV